MNATTLPAEGSMTRKALRLLLQPWLRVTIEGADHVPTSGPVLLAATHSSHADSVALGLALSRPIYFVGDKRLVSWPLLGPLLPRLGMIPIDRGSADTSTLSVVTDLLRAGALVGLYPEGSRSRDGRIYRPRSGVARLAQATGAAVLPVAIEGTADVWPVDRRPRLTGGRAQVRIGAAIALHGDGGPARRAFAEDLHQALIDLAGRPAAEGFAPIREAA